MRKLKTSDIPAFARALKQLGLKDRVKELAKGANSGTPDNPEDREEGAWNRGFDVIWDLFDTVTEAAGEKVLYGFLAGPFEMTPEQVADLDFDTLMGNLRTLATENNLISFFKFAARVMK